MGYGIGYIALEMWIDNIRSDAKVLELLHIMIGPNGCPHELKFTDEYYTDIEVLKRTIKSMAIDMTIDQVDDYLFILKMTRKSQ